MCGSPDITATVMSPDQQRTCWRCYAQATYRPDGLCASCFSINQEPLYAVATAPAPPESFESFMREVRDSLESHAERKGYSSTGANGENKLYDFCLEIGAEPGHTVGEAVYKLRELLQEPRAVLPIKVAAWMFLLWRKVPQLREQRGLPNE